MSTLSIKQLSVQEAMLLRLYPGKSLEDAKMEGDYSQIYVRVSSIAMNTREVRCKCIPRYEVIERFISRDEEIGLPPTLPRVLDSLGSEYTYSDGYICTDFKDKRVNKIYARKLRNDDGTDATLRDQSQETQDAVGKLWGVE